MIRYLHQSWLSLVLIGLLGVNALAQPTPSRRPMHVDDQSRAEAIAPLVASPDGQSVVFVRRRPALSEVMNALVFDGVRKDIWLQEAPGQPARKLIDGSREQVGTWAPQWSPDGKRLSFLLARDGTVSVWGWERGAALPRQWSTEPVDFAAVDGNGCQWLDERKLLCVMLPEGQRATPMGRGGYLTGIAVESAMAAWSKALRGESTASPVHSLEFRLPQRRLMIIDGSGAAPRVIAHTQLDYAGNWSLSPDAQTLAVPSPGPRSSTLFVRGGSGFPASLEFYTINGERLSFNRPVPANVVMTSFRWAPDGKSAMFFALEDASIHAELLYREGASSVVYPRVETKEYPGRLWRVDFAAKSIQQWATGDVDLGQVGLPPMPMWTRSGALLFRAPRLVTGGRPLRGGSAEWLILQASGETRTLLKTGVAPDELEPTEGAAAFLGVRDGEIWRIDPDHGTMDTLTEKVAPSVAQFKQIRDGQGQTLLLVAGREGPAPTTRAAALREKGLTYFLLDPRSGKADRIASPMPDAVLRLDLSGASDAIIFASSDTTGQTLWRAGAKRSAAPLASYNRFWAEIARPAERLIDYESLSGQPLKAHVTLPLDYQPGRRYPVVIDSDTNYTDTTNPRAYELSDGNEAPATTAALFAAAGYVYLWASMPVNGMDRIGRANLLSFTDGIVPAADKAVELGFGDPSRLFLIGGSSMGNAVYGLVTQTPKFKAAVASAGWTDQTIDRLSLDPLERYSDNPFDQTAMGSNYLSGSLPFWRNGEFQRRNSPLSYVDRVQTPLMIIHGDMDPISMTSAEMFFKALVMQRKPAQFVRYWGEGHGNFIPANRRDQYQRIFAWFDNYGDMTRDVDGRFVFDGEAIRARKGAPALTPEDFARFGPTMSTPGLRSQR